MEKSEAERLLGRAQDAFDAGEWQECAELYEQVLAHYPDERRSEVWWYDAALAYKFLRDWPKAYELGREAAARSPRGESDPAFWNLGIAATILREWEVARDAWRGFGFAVPDGEGEITDFGGMACVRLDTDGEREVVWAQRLCPTRARVVNVPVTPGRRFGEIVVHDGEPKGERVVEGETYYVFDELMLFEDSRLPTLSVTVNAERAADLEELISLFAGRDFGAEPASGVRTLCACCSEGSHEQTRSLHEGAQQLALAAPEAEARQLLDAWAGAVAIGRSWSGLQPVC
ncbi:tetratricopeptide repeat protein [Streptomyces sp. NPDC007861]|uniref:tetratricopeptide repeat protein n=1 Tax=Streptomyces sp. NPDC007861 TaxID=3154893 RepID=UPI0033CA2D73